MTPKPRRALLVVSIMLATVMQTLDSTIANVALPHMQGSMAATQDEISWVLTSYIIAAAIATPATGFLAHRFGRKNLLLIAISGFTVTSMLCGMATSLPEIVIFRLIQGAFGASFVPLSQTIMLDMFPIEQRGKMIALWGNGVMVGPIMGPALGGWLTDNYSWRWVFYINLPFGILAFLGMMISLSKTREKMTKHLDWAGFAFLSLAIGSVQIMLDRGNVKDWFSSTEIVTYAIVGSISFYLFVTHSLTTRQPFIDLSLFRDRNLSVGLCVAFIIGFVLYATMALMPPFLESLMNYPVTTAGLVIAPRGIGTMLAMSIAGRIINRIDPRFIIVGGLSLASLSLWEMTLFNLDVSTQTIVMTGLLQGFGLGFIFAPLTTISFATLAPNLRPEGTSLYSLLRNVGSSVGIAVSQAIITRLVQINHASIAEKVTITNPLYRSGAMPHIFDPNTRLGIAALNAEVTKQASVISYLNDFRLMMFMTLIAIPFVFLMRPIRHSGELKDEERAHMVMD